MAEGTFREELYYRLNVIYVFVPPLRDRRTDIIPLAEHFLEMYSSRMSKEVMDISPEARELMLNHDWPGNVRELENAIERAVVLAREDTLFPQDLPFSNQFQRPNILRQASRGEWDLKKLEKEYILNVLAECSDNHSQAAKRLGIARNTLWRKLKEYDFS